MNDAATIAKVTDVHGGRHPELSEIQQAYESIRAELDERLPLLRNAGKLLEAQRRMFRSDLFRQMMISSPDSEYATSAPSSRMASR